MDAAQTTITTVDAAVGFGLSSFYSSVADAVAMAAVSAVLAMADAVVVTTMAIAANGLSFFLFSSAAVVMAVDCSLTTMMDVAIIAACGLSFFFSSAVMASVVITEATVDVDVEIISANLLETKKKMAGCSRHFSYCIGRENKPPAMQVCPQIALASSKNSRKY